MPRPSAVVVGPRYPSPADTRPIPSDGHHTMSQDNHYRRRVTPPGHRGSSEDVRNMHDIFSDPYRCAVLYYLQRMDGPATLSEVARAVLEWSPDDDAVRPDDRPRTWLLDTHVRQLEEFGVIRYDPERGQIRLSEDVLLSVTEPWQDA